jgi:hypothetical protein
LELPEDDTNVSKTCRSDYNVNIVKIKSIYEYVVHLEDVLVNLNPGLLWQKLHLTRRGLFLLAKWT